VENPICNKNVIKSFRINDAYFFNIFQMKKLILLVLMLTMFVAVAPSTSATDICTNDPLSSADYNVEITSGVYLRDLSCMDSNVITTLSQGEVVHVIGKVEGWHKIERENGTTGWIWETFVTDTNKSFNPVGTDPIEELEVHAPMFDIAGHKYEDAIWFVYDSAIVEGYPDNSYQPDRVINRAELLKIIVESSYNYEFQAYEGASCFTDVPADQWYAKYVCFAYDEGVVEGYADGSFKPAQEINFVEALKIAMIGFGYEYTAGDPWYFNIVTEAGDNNFIPLDVDAFSEKFTRAQMAELITRMMKYNYGELEDYTQTGDSSYFVTYESIDAGLNVENLVGTGKCISEGVVYESGDAMGHNCVCGDGVWYCDDLPDVSPDAYLNWGEASFLMNETDDLITYTNSVFGIYYINDLSFELIQDDFEVYGSDPNDSYFKMTPVDEETCTLDKYAEFTELLDNTGYVQSLKLPLVENYDYTILATKAPEGWTLEDFENYAECTETAMYPITIAEEEVSPAAYDYDVVIWGYSCPEEHTTCVELKDLLDEFLLPMEWVS
jgi:hypothetical protein